MALTRKQFLTGATGVAAAYVFARSSARAAEFTYKLGHDLPLTHPIHIRLAEAAEKIGKDSNGRLIVQVYPSSQLGGMTQMIAQVRSGALEFLPAADSVLANLIPALSLAALPFAFKGYKDFWAAMDGPFGASLRQKLRGIGLHAFDKVFDTGFRHIITVDKPVQTPADLAGLKIRVPQAPIMVALFRALGASPTPLNNNELYTAMQTHLVDGAELPLNFINAGKYYETAKYVTLTSHQPTPDELLANGAAWDRLPPDLQDIVSRNFSEAALLERADIANNEKRDQELLEQHGIKIITPDQAAFRAVVQKAGLYAEWRDKYGAELFALLEAAQGPLH